MKTSAEFDLVVHGASGFTGRLVAEHLVSVCAGGEGPRWAMSGRNADKLAAVRDEIGAPADTPLIVADAGDAGSLAALTARARAVLTTVGPYQLYGGPLVAACAEAGVDYLDLSGETAWMRAMIDAHTDQARAAGARILFSCGFDSIPFELGVLHLQQVARARRGKPFPRVKGRVRDMRGGFSGGTVASGRATAAAVAHDPAVLALLRDPFSLTPGCRGPAQPSGRTPAYDEDLGSWTAPFIMADINTRNVHRSNLLQHHGYGRDFVYDEMLATGPGERGEAAARAVAAAPPIGGADAPRPGEGPGREERENGGYDIVFIGLDGSDEPLWVSVSGDRDPGYGSTSKIIAQTAIHLLDRDDVAGGVWTPGAALGPKLIERLTQHAGLTIAVEDASAVRPRPHI